MIQKQSTLVDICVSNSLELDLVCSEPDPKQSGLVPLLSFVCPSFKLGRKYFKIFIMIYRFWFFCGEQKLNTAWLRKSNIVETSPVPVLRVNKTITFELLQWTSKIWAAYLLSQNWNGKKHEFKIDHWMGKLFFFQKKDTGWEGRERFHLIIYLLPQSSFLRQESCNKGLCLVGAISRPDKHNHITALTVLIAVVHLLA